MREQPLHPDLAARWGNLSFIQYHGNGEWSAVCPRCSDSGHVGHDAPDRFRMFGPSPGKNSRGWCRACGFFSWADQGEDYSRPSPEAIAAAQAEREQLAAAELEKTKAKLRAIEASDFWRAYHDMMTERERQLWRDRGLCNYFIDYYALGYRTDYTVADVNWTGPALTIPHYGDEWKLTNVQYRLQEPPPGVGKYRQTAGLPAAMFRTEPEQPLTGAVLVVEGAIKSAVLYQHLGGNPLGFPLTIVGIPSKAPSASMLQELKDAETVYIGLDPDAYDGGAQRVGQKLGRDRVRYVHFPAKPDDLIVQYGLDGDALKKYLRGATKTA